MTSSTQICKAQIVNRKEEYTQFVLEALYRGYRSEDIARLMADKFSITQREATKRIKGTTKYLVSQHKERIDTLIERTTIQLEKIYLEAIREKNFPLALQVIDRICKLFGLDKPVKTIHDITIQTVTGDAEV